MSFSHKAFFSSSVRYLHTAFNSLEVTSSLPMMQQVRSIWSDFWSDFSTFQIDIFFSFFDFVFVLEKKGYKYDRLEKKGYKYGGGLGRQFGGAPAAP
jgi:hypothetical protein